MAVLGAAAPATERLMRAGSLGAIAGPASIRCIDVDRRAEADATTAGLSGAGNPRSRFAAAPMPATPLVALVSAVRAGWAVGLLVGRDAWATAGLATA